MYFLISKEGNQAPLKVAEPQNSLCNGSADPQKAALCLRDVSVVASALRSEALRQHRLSAWSGMAAPSGARQLCVGSFARCWGVLWSGHYTRRLVFPQASEFQTPSGSGLEMET